jgi:hypothetical protein
MADKCGGGRIGQHAGFATLCNEGAYTATERTTTKEDSSMKLRTIWHVCAALVLAVVLTMSISGVALGAVAETEISQIPQLALTPEDATNSIQTIHSLTATTSLGGERLPGAEVKFEVISGPHVGTNDTVECTDGVAHWSYKGTKAGQDIIRATLLSEAGPAYATATKTWEDDGVPPVPELPTVALVGVGILGIMGFVGFRRMRSHRSTMAS